MTRDINLRLPRVKEITALSTSTIWRLEKAGNFPKRKRIGKRAVAWSADEIQQWIRNLKPASVYTTPRYDEVFFEGQKWLDTL